MAESYLRIHTTGQGKAKLAGAGLFESVPHVRWDGPREGDTFSVPFAVDEAGDHVIRLDALRDPGYGAFDVEVDGKAVAKSFSLAGVEGPLDLTVGAVNLAAGEHTLTFRCVSVGGLAVEKLNLLKLPPKAMREVKGLNERHFIKLALGSAIYRHRLVYGEMPRSLEQLVEMGLLDPRFLKDENLYPLQSRLEGDTLVVESAAQEPWSHSWKGLDPRR